MCLIGAGCTGESADDGDQCVDNVCFEWCFSFSLSYPSEQPITCLCDVVDIKNAHYVPEHG